MKTTRSIYLALIAVLLSPMVANAVPIDVDGAINASLDGTNAVSVFMEAGTYDLSFTDEVFTAFSRFPSSSGCVNGADCVTGWENSVRYIIDATTFRFGDGDASGGLGPFLDGGYYADEATSFANAVRYSTSFTLTSASNVNFFLYDDKLSDNRGGVSLLLERVAVPEPGTLALLGLGLAGIGFARRKTA